MEGAAAATPTRCSRCCSCCQRPASRACCTRHGRSTTGLALPWRHARRQQHKCTGLTVVITFTVTIITIIIIIIKVVVINFFDAGLLRRAKNKLVPRAAGTARHGRSTYSRSFSRRPPPPPTVRAKDDNNKKK